MEQKPAVMLLVLVETARLRWFVAALGMDGRAVPLLRSDVGDLDKYRDVAFDEQVSFLRHRLCGVLQRGCDRIWARGAKACQFVIVFDGLLPEPTGKLTQVVAEHFTEWMLNPPVVVFNKQTTENLGDSLRFEKLAGELDPQLEPILLARLGEVCAARDDLGAWEFAPKKGAPQPALVAT
jgi:hypothetical protein